MSVKRRLHRLITDALSVWRTAEASRPFTRRGLSENELLEEYRRLEGEGDQKKKADNKANRSGKKAG